MKTGFYFALLCCLTIVLSLIYLSLGSYGLSLGQVIGALFGSGSPEEQLVVCDIRLPRLLGVLCTGAALSLCGTVMQSIFNNPLVSPDILGVSSGAACGACGALVLGCSSTMVCCSSFSVGLIAVLLAVLIAKFATSNDQSMLVLVLSGIVVSAFFSGIVELICAFNPQADEFPSILFFLFGSMTRITMSDLPLLAGTTVVTGVLFWRMGFALDVISLGQEDAIGLGVPTAKLRYLIIGISSVVCGIFIAKVGMIGWVGLIVPHLARLWIGVRHRVMIPAAMIIGALFLLLVDLVCRNLLTYEIPIGIVTSLIGAPVFVVVLYKSLGRFRHAGI